METNNNDIGKAFKDAFDDFTIEPSAELWNKIEKENISTTPSQSFISLISYVASIAAVITVSAVIYFFINKDVELIVERHISSDDIEELAKNTPSYKVEEIKNITTTDSIKVEELNCKKEKIIENIEKQIVDVQIENVDKQEECLEIDSSDEEKMITEISIEIDDFIEDSNVEIDLLSESEIEVNIVDQEDVITPNIDTFVVSFGNDQLICFGEDANLIVEEGHVYKWSNGAIGNKITVSPTENSIYSVTVSNEKGQSVTHEYRVEIDRSCSALFIPSAFTPNGDGRNDLFKAEGQGIVKMKMYVYNKNGNKVFEANSIDESWDGTYNGKQGAGIFFYVVEYVDALECSHVRKGQVVIVK